MKLSENMSSDYTFSLYQEEGVSDLFDINIPRKSPASQLIADASEELFEDEEEREEEEEAMNQLHTSNA